MNSQLNSDIARNQMWIDILGEEYLSETCKNKRKRMRLKFAKKYNIMPSQITLYNYKQFIPHHPGDYLEPLTNVGFNYNIPDQRKENTMNAYTSTMNAVVTQADPMIAQRNYLKDRLYEVLSTKSVELERQFYLTVDAPKTVEDFLDRIKNGKYTLYHEDKDFYHVTDFLYDINWRTADQKPDKVGYNLAYEALKEAATKTRDQINIADPKDGLKAIQDLEAWTYTAA